MKEAVLLLGTLALWIALNRWIVPYFGVSTCMSGGCSTSHCPACGTAPAAGLHPSQTESKGIEL